jgi:hypothetical protein
VRIAAVDPGKTCGFAWLTTDVAPWRFQSWERDRFDAVQYVGYLARNNALHLIVCESFVPRPGVRSWQPDALEVIGALRQIANDTTVPLETQAPADAKRFSTNDKLSKLDWRNPTPGGHADDAARHLLLAAVRHGFIDPAQFV